MSRLSLLAAALLAAPALAHAESAGSPDPQPAAEPAPETIIGGTAVPAGKWPDTVAVLGAGGSCTGTLIAPDVVLTAGHCAEVNPTRVIANSLNYAAPGGTSATVKSITAYPNWEASYDVSVIVLTAPIAGVTPRNLGTACTFQGFVSGSSVHLVGFGSTDIQGGGTNTRLNEVSVTVTDPDCTRGNGCVAAVSPGGEFVAGGAGKDSCFGDSGGPVYLDTPRGPVVIGAVSRGTDGATTPCGGGGIYVRTDKIAAWIESTTGKQIAKDTCAGSGSGSGSGTGTGTGRGDGADGLDGADAGDVTGGCSTTGASGGLGLGAPLALGLLAAARRRRARASEKKAQD